MTLTDWSIGDVRISDTDGILVTTVPGFILGPLAVTESRRVLGFTVTHRATGLACNRGRSLSVWDAFTLAAQLNEPGLDWEFDAQDAAPGETRRRAGVITREFMDTHENWPENPDDWEGEDGG